MAKEKAEKPHRKFYGIAIVGERGQLVVPVEAREELGIKPGDRLVVLNAHGNGLVLLKADIIRKMAEGILDKLSIDDKPKKRR